MIWVRFPLSHPMHQQVTSRGINQTIYNLAPGTVPPKAPGHQSVGSSRCRRLEDAKVGELDIGEVPPPSSELHSPHLLGGTLKVSQLQIGIFYQLTSILPPPCLVILSSCCSRLDRGWVDPTKRELAIVPPDPSATRPVPVSALVG